MREMSKRRVFFPDGGGDGGSPKPVSNLRKTYVACLCRLVRPLSHVGFINVACHFRIVLSSMSLNGPMSCYEYKRPRPSH